MEKFFLVLEECPLCTSSNITRKIHCGTEETSFETCRILSELTGEYIDVPHYSLCNECYNLFEDPSLSDKALSLLYGDRDLYRELSLRLFIHDSSSVNEDSYYSFIDPTLLGVHPRATAHYENLVWVLKILATKGLPQPQVIYDIGAGTGGAEASSKYFGIEYNGIESSTKCREIAQSRGRNVQSFLQESSNSTNKVSIVMSHQVVEHLRQPVLTLSRYITILKHKPEYLFFNVPTYELYPCGSGNIGSRSMLNMFNISHLTLLNHVSGMNLLRLCGYVPVGYSYHKGDLMLLGKAGGVKTETNKGLRIEVPASHTLETLIFNLKTFIPAYLRMR